MTKQQQTLDLMVKLNIIPEKGMFDITEEMLNQYIRLYSAKSMGNAKFQIALARKLAGLNLLYLKFARGGNYSSCREGIVYIINNPVWSGQFKIGMTINLDKRLGSMQTSDPYRAFKVVVSEFVLDRISVEKDVLKKFSTDLDLGEWVKLNKYSPIIEHIRASIEPDFSGLEIVGGGTHSTIQCKVKDLC